MGPRVRAFPCYGGIKEMELRLGNGPLMATNYIKLARGLGHTPVMAVLRKWN